MNVPRRTLWPNRGCAQSDEQMQRRRRPRLLLFAAGERSPANSGRAVLCLYRFEPHNRSWICSSALILLAYRRRVDKFHDKWAEGGHGGHSNVLELGDALKFRKAVVQVF